MSFFRDQMRIVRFVGAKDFDGAIKMLTEGLANTKEDALSLEMIAHCHQWAGRGEMAIASAKKLLELSPKYFGAFELLSQIYAERGEHETAAHYARLGLENYPEPQPQISRTIVQFVQLLFRALGLFSSRFRKAAEVDTPDPNKLHENWYAWAKQYLKWYDDTHTDPMNPRVH